MPVFLVVLFNSCIKDEAPNSEADILECVVPDPQLKIGGKKTIQPSLGSHTIKIWVKPGSEIGTFAPEFKLTPGATISPESGTDRTFSISTPVTYTVTSEDGKYTKTYSILFDSYALGLNEPGKRTFHFEHTKSYDGKYLFDIFYEEEINDDNVSQQDIWDSGNLGFALTSSSAPAEDYPTASTPNGKTGKGAILVTRSTGSFGANVGMPIAAGNLFLGTFDIQNAIAKPLEATHFGINAKIGMPDSLKFWYKFKAGPVYKNKSGQVLDKIDQPSMYAVFYDPMLDEYGNPVSLNGTNVLSAENIIAVAKMDESNTVHSDDIENAEYTKEVIPFVYLQNNIDPVKLLNGSYFITIVFSASAEGKYFEGAVGSTLYIDEVELICK